MSPLIRLIVLWILIVSLPIQGIAASVRLPCTMAHGSAASQSIGVRDNCDDQAMMSAKVSHNASTAAAHNDIPCDQGSHQKHPSCSACSACCVGASAPPPLGMSFSPVEYFASDYISPNSSITGWIPSRIERPPRL